MVSYKNSLSISNRSWSNELFGLNFNQCYQETFQTVLLKSGDEIRSGGSFIYTERYHNSRIIYWEALNDVVCFSEENISSSSQLSNSSVLVRVGASPILDILIESSSKLNEYHKECFSLSISIIQQDGNINHIKLENNKNQCDCISILHPLVELKEGKIVTLGATMNANKLGICFNRHTTSKDLPTNCKKVMDSSSTDPSLILKSNTIESVPVDRDIICVSWISSSLLVLGLSAGDLLLVNLAVHSTGGRGERMKEQLLKDSRGNLVQVLWSEFLGTVPSYNFDTICVSSLLPINHPETAAENALLTYIKDMGVVLAVNRSGELRVWHVLSKAELVLQSSIYSLFENIQGLHDFLISDRLKNASDIKSSLLLESCILRLGFDYSLESKSASTFILGTLAFLPSSNNSQYSKDGLETQQQQTQKFPPGLIQQPWQIILFGWQSAASSGTGSYGDKMRMIIKPISFPLYANQKRTDKYSEFLFRSASLIDIQMIVDSKQKTITIISVWRVIASRLSSNRKGVDSSHVQNNNNYDKVVFESMIGKVVIPLESLRATNYASRCIDINELESYDMDLISDNHAIERYRCITVDEALLAQNVQRTQSEFGESEENKIKVMMMKRIFIPRRFSREAIFMAYVSFKKRFAQLLLNNKHDDIIQEIISTNQQLIHTLPHLVLEICTSVAQAKSQISDFSLIRHFGKENIAKCSTPVSASFHHTDYLELLSQTFSAFLSECELSSCRYERVTEGCLLRGLQQPRPASSISSNMMQWTGISFDCVLLQCGGVKNIIKSTAAVINKDIIFNIQKVDRLESIFHALDRQMSDVFDSPFREIDCLLNKAFDKSMGENDFSLNLFWVEDYFKSLSLSVNSAPLDVLESIRSICSCNNTNCYCPYGESLFDRLLDLDFSNQTLQEFSIYQWKSKEENFNSRKETTPSTAYIAMISQYLLQVIEQQIHRSKLTIILLFYLQETGCSVWMSGELYAEIRNIYIPKAINQLVYLSLLIWFNNVRPTNNAMLKSSIEISSLFPLSPSSYATCSNELASSASIVIYDENISVLENFVLYVCTLKSSEGCNISDSADNILFQTLRVLFTSLHPSVQGDLAKYLFFSGQYISLSKWASVIKIRYHTFQLQEQLQVANKIQQQSDCALTSDYNSLSQLLVRYRMTSTQLIAEYYELTRCRWIQLSRGCDHAITNNRDIEMKAIELINANFELENFIAVTNSMFDDDIRSRQTISNSEMKQQTTSCSLASSQYDLFVSILENQWEQLSLEVAASRDNRSSSSPLSSKSVIFNTRIHIEIEGCLLMRDLLQSFYSHSHSHSDPHGHSQSNIIYAAKYSSMMIREAALENNYEEVNDNQNMLRTLCLGFCKVANLAISSDIIEILDISSSILPLKVASSVVVAAIEKNINFINKLLNNNSNNYTAFSNSCSSDVHSTEILLMQELYLSWSRVFEYLLADGDKYEQALEAIKCLAEVEVANIEHSRSNEGSQNNQTTCTVSWRECLHALVAQACNCGKLEWLCSIPLNMTIHSLGNPLNLSDAIARTLEDLANTLEIVVGDKKNNTTHVVNYFECLFVYLLSRQNYREAARIMHVYNNRLENKASLNPTSTLESQISALSASNQSLKILPPDQTYILYTSPAASIFNTLDRFSEDLPTIVCQGHDRVELIDSLSLGLLFYIKYCQHIFLQDSERLYNINSIEINAVSECLDKLVLNLCSIGRYQEVLSLTQLYDNLFKHQDHLSHCLSWLKQFEVLNGGCSLTTDLTDLPLIALARESTLIYSIEGSNALLSKAVPILNDTYFKSPINPIMSHNNDNEIELYCYSTQSSKINGKILWKNLICLLFYLQSSCSHNNTHSTKWLKVTLRAALGLNTSTFSDNNADDAIIPLSLIDLYTSGGLNKSIAIFQKGIVSSDPSSLLLLLIEFHHYQLACKVTIQMIQDYHDDNHLDNNNTNTKGTTVRTTTTAEVVSRSRSKVILPYTVFDQLINSCVIELKRKHNKRLSMYLQMVKNLIEYHFSILCTEGV